MMFYEHVEFWIMIVIGCSYLLIEKGISIIYKYFKIRREGIKNDKDKNRAI